MNLSKKNYVKNISLGDQLLCILKKKNLKKNSKNGSKIECWNSIRASMWQRPFKIKESAKYVVNGKLYLPFN